MHSTETGARSESPIAHLWQRVVRGDATKEQAKDTGMAVVLVLLLIAVAGKRSGYISGAIVVHVLNMTAPQLFRPFAVLWFALSHVMGLIVSKIIMGMIFFGVVTPIGVWRRLRGADALQLKTFKSGRGSVMEARDHLYIGKDIEQPY
jgi:hypothetical protein